MTLTMEDLRLNVTSLLRQLRNTSSASVLNDLWELRTQAQESLESDKDALLCCLFLDAILDHCEGKEAATGHLYLEQYEIPQIKLFDILINRFPFVSASHAISNKLISGWIDGQSHATVLDIGIGRGIQMVSLIKELENNKHLKELTIIGIEPFGDAIIHATKLISQAASSAPFKVNQHIIEGFAEKADMEVIKRLIPESCGKLVVNASLAVHHIPSVHLREHLFSQLKSLNPDAIVLTEPDSDHMTNDWAQRTANAWIHYGAIFDTIDGLHISREDKNGLKMFFGREIKDVVGTPDADRFERHEPAAHWVNYGEQIGMQTYQAPELALARGSANGFNILQTDVIMMQHKNTPVLAVIPLIKHS